LAWRLKGRQSRGQDGKFGSGASSKAKAAAADKPSPKAAKLKAAVRKKVATEAAKTSDKKTATRAKLKEAIKKSAAKDTKTVAKPGTREAKIAQLKARVAAANKALDATKAKATAPQATKPTETKIAKLKTAIAKTKKETPTVSIKGQAIERLFNSQPGTMRPESLTFLRSGGKDSAAMPVTLTRYAGDSRVLGTDGRHRITVAREHGETKIQGVLREIGKRGGVKKRRITIEL
jgi:hypothetical protein